MPGPILNKFPTLPPRPYVVRGEGPYFFTEDGRRILDATSGTVGAAVLGYSHPAVTAAMKEQIDRICHISYNTWNNRILEDLAEVLLSRAPAGLDRVYFAGLSGSEAVEAAIKLSFQTHQDAGKSGKNWLLCREQGFHGTTLHALSVGGLPVADYYRPLFPERIARVPAHDPINLRKPGESPEDYAERSACDLEAKILEIGPGRVAAFIGETMLGSYFGDVPPAPGYWRRVREICDRHDIHLILDEVYCGLGRSGRVHCCDHDGIAPDFLCLSKALGAGYAPLSAVLTSGKVERVVAAGPVGRVYHGHSHQGHALAAAAALAAQKIIHAEGMVERIAAIGARLARRLGEALAGNPFFGPLRGRGVMLSMPYADSAPKGFGAALHRILEEDHSILVNARGAWLSVAPAFIFTDEQVDQVVAAISRAAPPATKSV
ncbi:MAG: aspartate aminotransferase family protein [Rhodospirillaceae bacterium]|nr:aspartate aminotransferase family protein [Rhodospirillaceae bacterium]